MGCAPTSPPEIDAIGGTNHIWVDTTTVSTDPTYTHVDLFCGPGGVGVGFGQGGFRCVRAVEMDEDAAATYQLNFPYSDLVLTDIRDLSDDEIVSRLDGVAVDVVSAGWPCQGISPIGEQDLGDPRNVLYREVVRFVRLLRPHFVLLENVPALLQRKFRWLLDDLLACLADAGYPDASVMLLDAADYGVPQHRERVITIANPYGWKNPYPHPLPDRHVTAREALDDLRTRQQSRSANHVHVHHGDRFLEKIARIQAGDLTHRRSRVANRLLDPDLPSLTAIYCRGSRFIHYAEDRMLTPLEYARLQGFPDSHLFEGSKGSVGEQICNAVPPPLARCLALALRPSLDRMA